MCGNRIRYGVAIILSGATAAAVAGCGTSLQDAPPLVRNTGDVAKDVTHVTEPLAPFSARHDSDRADNALRHTFIVAGDRQFHVAFGREISIQEIRFADAKTIEIVREIPAPIMKTDDKGDAITELKGAAWLDDGIVLAFTMKFARDGRSQHFWATNRGDGRQWAVQAMALAAEPELPPYAIREVLNPRHIGDSIIIVLDRTLAVEQSYSRDLLWYQHDCPVLSIPDDSIGKYYRFFDMREVAIKRTNSRPSE